MKTIDKLIFDELAGRRRVLLPGIGTLGTERRAAVLKSARTLQGPFNLVSYSRREDTGAPSVVALLAAEGMGPEAAQAAYEGWLEQARRGATVAIEQAGVLESGFFKVAPPLAGVLNPGYERTVRLKLLHNRRGYWIGGAILLCLLLGGAGYFIYGGACPAFRSGPRSVAPAGSLSPGELPADTLQAEAPAGSPAAEPGRATDTGAVVPASGWVYYVVAGVYSTDENAERAIAKIRRQDAGVVCQKRPFAGGKIMISLYHSADESQAAAERHRLAARLAMPDVWVYKSKAGR